MIACYTDRLSLFPGERFTLHASSSQPECRLEVARVGGERQVVHRSEVSVGHYPRPADADRDGCGWPACLTLTIG